MFTLKLKMSHSLNSEIDDWKFLWSLFTLLRMVEYRKKQNDFQGVIFLRECSPKSWVLAVACQVKLGDIKIIVSSHRGVSETQVHSLILQHLTLELDLG